MGVDIDRGAGYGNTLTWSTSGTHQPETQQVEIQFDLDRAKFYRMFANLMKAPTPH
jgi:hypothetical protein